MIFEWDETKSRRCFAERGFDFAHVSLIFADEDRVERMDRRRDYGEERWQTIGEVGGKIYFVVFTYRGESESFPRGERMSKKSESIARARLGTDGKLRRLTDAGRILRGRVNPARLDSPAAFAPDADTPFLTRRELREMRPARLDQVPDVAAVRRRLRLSQGAFAQLFGIPLATVKDWEQGRRSPDAPARAYLRVIANDPAAVRRALEAS